MIPDATLAEWEESAKHLSGNHTWCGKSLLQTIAEIRRLREEVETIKGGDAYFFMIQLKTAQRALTAHRAVVRELVELLTADVGPRMASLDAAFAWIDHKRAALADPLVVAAREGDAP